MDIRIKMMSEKRMIKVTGEKVGRIMMEKREKEMII
jgi:hypothetical protein